MNGEPGIFHHHPIHITTGTKGGGFWGELLRIDHISKRFGDFYANRDINLTIMEGEIHTLLGENGAGKSTLMNILCGLYQPTDGRLFLRGKEVHIGSPSHAVELGIGMVHQHFMLVRAMTVFENIILGDRRGRGIFIDYSTRRAEIEELADRYGFNVQLDRQITEISVGEQQRVEILKALYRGADLLILDEPTAALTDIEVEGLFDVMEKLKSEGKSIIFISHKMREVMHASDRITILRAGETVKTVSRGEMDGKQLASLMIGRDLTKSNYEKKTGSGRNVAELSHISYHKNMKHSGLNDVSMTIRGGEIVGIAGVDGNGQTQLAQIVTGVITPDEGEMKLAGEKIAVFDPLRFIENGTAHVPEDRNLQGLIGDMGIQDNIVLKRTDIPEFSKGKGLFLKKKEISEYAGEMAERYDIRCRSVRQAVRSLSGGKSVPPALLVV
ncbi:MAG: ATP-binding cassette domain-containing protein [Lachnospiraceae bacterium]|nr:ATP-binding cassette domain-containing protein [Lachnospiraceae bacterium]